MQPAFRGILLIYQEAKIYNTAAQQQPVIGNLIAEGSACKTDLGVPRVDLLIVIATN